jgi:hypothetical protein
MKFPLTIIPLVLLLILLVVFGYYVPNGEDLISKSGDYILGLIVGISLAVCIVIDWRRFKSGS